ncbi:MAG TPA: type II toxin-antitoxin system VapC family toxin [Rhodocyclaceae bacterium]|nr:type II toxin-antitoxin system VapC family toxin [Rhodocyclaceae bacterium]
MRYLLDTNICIYLMNRRPPEVAERFDALTFGAVAMSAITLAELRHGIERRSEVKDEAERALAMLLDQIPAIPFDGYAAEEYGRLMAPLAHRSRDAIDRLIASHAASLDLVLVTNNEADFRDYSGLKVENWVTGFSNWQ